MRVCGGFSFMQPQQQDLNAAEYVSLIQVHVTHLTHLAIGFAWATRIALEKYVCVFTQDGVTMGKNICVMRQ